MSSRYRILVVDDDQMIRNLVVSYLRKDYLVSVASTGKEAYDKALEHRPDLVIIDIQMPGWDGLQTLAAFQNHPQLNTVKKMMLTGDAKKGTVMAAIKGGASGYMIKTRFNKEEFLGKVSDVLEQPQRTNSVAESAPHIKADRTTSKASEATQQSPGPDQPSAGPVPESKNAEILAAMETWE